LSKRASEERLGRNWVVGVPNRLCGLLGFGEKVLRQPKEGERTSIGGKSMSMKHPSVKKKEGGGSPAKSSQRAVRDKY